MNLNFGTIYISGPMTGLPEHNFPAFNAAEEDLTAQGYSVVNPARNFGGRTDLDPAIYLHFDFLHILVSDGLYLLPGWSKSKGARAEYLIAHMSGKTILFHPEAEMGYVHTIVDRPEGVLSFAKETKDAATD